MATTNNGDTSRSQSRSQTFSTPFNITDISQIRKIFDHFDKNGDGKISGEELAGVLLTLGSKTTTEEATKMTEKIDRDGDGDVSLDEFAEFCGGKVDGDGNGYQELKNAVRLVLSRLGEKCSDSDCERMFLSAVGDGGDGDGELCFDDFCKLVMTILEKSVPSSQNKSTV